MYVRVNLAGRHASGHQYFADHGRPAQCHRIAVQGEGPNAARPMTLSAVGGEDGCNILLVRNRVLSRILYGISTDRDLASDHLLARDHRLKRRFQFRTDGAAKIHSEVSWVKQQHFAGLGDSQRFRDFLGIIHKHGDVISVGGNFLLYCLPVQPTHRID